MPRSPKASASSNYSAGAKAEIVVHSQVRRSRGTNGMVRAFPERISGFVCLSMSRAANDLSGPEHCQTRARGPGCGFPPTLVTADGLVSLRSHSQAGGPICPQPQQQPSPALHSGQQLQLPILDGDTVTPDILESSRDGVGTPHYRERDRPGQLC